MKQRPGIILYRELADTVKLLQLSQAGRLFIAILESDDNEPDFSDDPVLMVLWSSVRQKLERDRQRYDSICEARKGAGKISGEKRRERANAQFVEQTRTKRTSVNFVEQNEPTITITETITKPKTITETKTKTETVIEKEMKTQKHRYGEYKNVLLTDEELNKLKTELPNHWDKIIERLSEYMASKGVSYKSHYATILAWARREGIAKGEPATVPVQSGRRIDADEMAAIKEMFA